MFVDEVEIRVAAGAGGSGCVSFRREKHVPRGGPDGGNGGRGGSIVVIADANLTTLVDFRFEHDYKAARGGQGEGNNRSGKDGADIVLKVPVGTVIVDLATGEPMVDLIHAGQKEILAKGGQGGRGNAMFVSSTHQTPRFAEKGEPAEERTLRLDLKLLADVGLIGFPNVGKSTLISRISAAKPKIADYPFTTLVPNLGVVSLEPGSSFVVADIPGLIEGASEGAGLGHQFLRHIERTRVLVHLVDLSELSGRDPWDDYLTVNRELEAYSPRLSTLPQLVALNKVDVVSDPDLVSGLVRRLEEEDRPVFVISAVTGLGLKELLYAIKEALDAAPLDVATAPEVQRVSIRAKAVDEWEVRKTDEGFDVVGPAVERLVAMTDMNNEASVNRLHRILTKRGIISRLRDLGASEGDSVRIGREEFDFVD